MRICVICTLCGVVVCLAYNTIQTKPNQQKLDLQPIREKTFDQVKPSQTKKDKTKKEAEQKKTKQKKQKTTHDSEEEKKEKEIAPHHHRDKWREGAERVWGEVKKKVDAKRELVCGGGGGVCGVLSFLTFFFWQRQ